MNIGKVSLADRVFDELENKILDGKYKAGELLTETHLSDELGVSRTPIREAIRRLAQDGLIEETTRGALVLGITADEVATIYEIRARIEGYAARLFAERVSDDVLRELRENVELQEFYISRAAAESSGDLDTRFHEIIYENCGSRVLYDLLSSLHKKVRRYRRASYEDKERSVSAAKEHRAILDAAVSHNGDLAEALVTSHVKNAEESIIRNLKNKEDI